LEELFESVSPRLFAAIMSDPQLSEGAAELKDDDKVRLTDNYASRKGVLTEDGREALAKVVDWDSDTAFFHLVKHPCDWVAARCSRGLYARILRNRRASLGRFETELQNGARTVARWYPFAWLQLISDAGVRKVSPTVKLVSLVSTLGGLVKAIDPCAFGFVNLFYSVEPFAKQFAPANVFVPGKYFMATAEGAVKPMIGIDFGAAAFEVESVSVDAQAQPKGDKHPPKPVPAQVIFKAARSVQGCYRQNDHAAVAVKLKKGQSDGQLLQLPGQFSVIAVEFLESNTNGSDLARLVSFEVEGHFTNT
jgi:hypothetical protein